MAYAREISNFYVEYLIIVCMMTVSLAGVYFVNYINISRLNQIN